MNYQEFLRNIEITISNKYASCCNIELKSIKKNNGLILDGLIIRNPAFNIAPTIYLNPYYHRFLNGQSLEEIYKDIVCTYESSIPEEDFDIDFFKDFNQVKKTLVMKLINFDKNAELLVDVPHMRFHDLAIIFQSMVCLNKKEQGTILICDSHLSLWGISLEELYQAALKSSQRLLPATTIDMAEYLDNMPYLDAHMYVLSNQAGINGASVILYDGFLKKLSEQTHSDLVLLPSSIHEFIAFPVNYISENDMEMYSSMVREVNAFSLPDDAILSDHAYYYSRKDQTIYSELEYICK